MLTFAVPYRKILAVFLPVVVLDAVIGAINPLILRALIDNGILQAQRRPGHRAGRPGWRSWPCSTPSSSLTERRISAVIGEGLIYDMRSKVFRHIQRMPLAFFTRTQTGALVSRLNNDVIGAQQAFTDLLSNVVGNLVTVVIVLGAMFFLSWQITLAALFLLPVFLIPARFVGQRIGSLTKEGYNLNTEMNMVMQERFNVGGAMLVKLLGRPEAEAESFEPRPAGSATSASPRPPTPGSSSSPSPSPPRWRRPSSTASAAWPPSTGSSQVGTVVALTQYLTRLYRPLTQLSNLNLDVMTAWSPSSDSSRCSTSSR